MNKIYQCVSKLRCDMISTPICGKVCWKWFSSECCREIRFCLIFLPRQLLRDLFFYMFIWWKLCDINTRINSHFRIIFLAKAERMPSYLCLDGGGQKNLIVYPPKWTQHLGRHNYAILYCKLNILLLKARIETCLMEN